MTEYTWPTGVDDPTPEDIRRAWPATVAALPAGTAVTGKVIGRQPFGVFVQIDGVPDGMGLAEISAAPHGTVPPPVGFAISGNVVSHADHNYQVRLRLEDWGDERVPVPLWPTERLADREALSSFLKRLRQDFEASGDQWENRTLDGFLEALEAWVADAPGSYTNHGQELPADGDWTFMARALSAARFYE
ncbi:hypothetical protein QFZ75_003797 [Streptomyces sp. V3I8]|uniref:DUF7660 family protein n=1 Tax=Streptomyces sp. V3I8 TaxID=3042279 RepID=UPI0027821683|nr:hypothetical protein [Streptomyces sp. V3I8]MDQ1037381.1 hypothetical protein [Streptomyces sp. V3I8]